MRFLILGETWCHTASCLLVLILLNDFEDVRGQIHLELVLSEPRLPDSLPKATNFLLRHLPVLRRRLIQLCELDQKPVVEHLPGVDADWVLRHDLDRYRVLARDDLRVGPHHIVLDVSGFHLKKKSN